MSVAKELIQKRSQFKPQKFPETPYNRAKEEWNDRLGPIVKNAHSWRLAFFIAMAYGATQTASTVYLATKSSIQPYYVRVYENGQPDVIGPVSDKYTPTQAEVRYGLTQWLEWTRGISLDPVLTKENYKRALGRMRQSAANKLNEWAQSDPRMANIGRETVQIHVTGVVPIPGTNSYSARWTEEQRNGEGGLKGPKQLWTGTFTLDIEPPKDEKTLLVNPIGMFIKDYQLTREN